jgi:single-strand DNA-binding protein
MPNNRVELLGHLGADPKKIEKDGKNFIAFSIATADSYPVKDGEEITWKERGTVWHNVLIFKPVTMNFARDLKKGDRVQLTGELSYRDFEAKDGYKHKEAVIIGTYVEKMHYEKQERMDYATAADEAFREGE